MSTGSFGAGFELLDGPSRKDPVSSALIYFSNLFEKLYIYSFFLIVSDYKMQFGD